MVHGLETLRRLNSEHPERQASEPKTKRRRRTKVKETPNPRHVAIAKLNRPWAWQVIDGPDGHKVKVGKMSPPLYFQPKDPEKERVNRVRQTPQVICTVEGQHRRGFRVSAVLLE